jgi:prepilin peptidase CpaA
VLLVIVTLALVVVAAAYDLKSREIPDWVPVLLLVAAAVAAFVPGDAMHWSWRVLGLAVGFGLGALLFALGAMGGGDAKLMAGIGAVIGLPALVAMLLYSAVAGGLLAAFARLKGRKELAYAPAFVLGLLVFLVARGGDLGTAAG